MRNARVYFVCPHKGWKLQHNLAVQSDKVECSVVLYMVLLCRQTQGLQYGFYFQLQNHLEREKNCLQRAYLFPLLPPSRQHK